MMCPSALAAMMMGKMDITAKEKNGRECLLREASWLVLCILCLGGMWCVVCPSLAVPGSGPRSRVGGSATMFRLGPGRLTHTQPTARA